MPPPPTVCAQRRAARENEPAVTEPLGPAPTTLSGDQLKAWADIVDTCPAGVLSKSDRIAVESCSKLLALDRIGKLDTAGARLLQSYLGKFAMTPADRSKVSVPKPEKKNAFNAL